MDDGASCWILVDMPWLMKAEPDSRVVKGKDVKVVGL